MKYTGKFGNYICSMKGRKVRKTFLDILGVTVSAYANMHVEGNSGTTERKKVNRLSANCLDGMEYIKEDKIRTHVGTVCMQCGWVQREQAT